MSHFRFDSGYFDSGFAAAAPDPETVEAIVDAAIVRDPSTAIALDPAAADAPDSAEKIEPEPVKAGRSATSGFQEIPAIATDVALEVADSAQKVEPE